MAAKQVYVVLREAWYFNDEFTTYSDERPIKAFTDRDQAEAYRQRCEEHEEALGAPEDPVGHRFGVVAMTVEG